MNRVIFRFIILGPLDARPFIRYPVTRDRLII